ncbi:hypothetical protein H4S07_004071, partial [Coemansia furcata]
MSDRIDFGTIPQASGKQARHDRPLSKPAEPQVKIPSGHKYKDSGTDESSHQSANKEQPNST